MALILASSSNYQKELFARLGLTFSCVSPEVDESVHHGEKPKTLVVRLAIEKAKAVAKEHSDGLIIGADQVAVLDNDIIGKPENHAATVRQLLDASGREI